jgi:tripeptide aminopeptidase
MNQYQTNKVSPITFFTLLIILMLSVNSLAQINDQIYANKIETRFIEYVKIDTQSDPDSKTTPSTEKQKSLGQLLVNQLLQLGLTDAMMDENGYVYATLPSNIQKQVPVIFFCAHMDTSPDCSGANVKPIVHRNYQGQDIILPDDPSVIIKQDEHPELSKKIGHDLITASGTTLLGADNKAGVAAIMNAVEFLVNNPEILHGTIKILFTPDEEIGRGVDKVNLKKLGADFGYTIDGEAAGSLENETFSANGMNFVFNGIAAHPGFAKGKMVSALKVAAQFIDNLPKNRLSPETTSEKEGFVHPVRITGSAEQATVQFIIRDFDTAKLDEHQNELIRTAQSTVSNFPGASFEYTIQEQYRNMKEILDKHPKIVDLAYKAIQLSGVEPSLRSIRGGTDGSRLSFMGLPCPNIFAGEHAFHSKVEWCTVQDMLLSSTVIVTLVQLWAEEASE